MPKLNAKKKTIISVIYIVIKQYQYYIKLDCIIQDRDDMMQI